MDTDKFDYVPSVGEVRKYFINTHGEVPEGDWKAYSEAKGIYGLNDKWVENDAYRKTISHILTALDLEDRF